MTTFAAAYDTASGGDPNPRVDAQILEQRTAESFPMIKSDEELGVVRQQIASAESALMSLRRDVRPKNEKTYRLMAESYVETVLELRALVDSYLDITSTVAADLVISLEGDRVSLGQTSAALVTRFVDAFRRGLQTVVKSIAQRSDTASAGQRREHWIEEICDLPIVGLTPGSVQVLLAEPRDQSLLREENHAIFTRALELIFLGMHWADTESDSPSDGDFLPESTELRQSILAVISQLLPPRSGPVSRVRYSRRTREHSDFSAATLSRASRTRLHDALKALVPGAEFKEVIGVIRKLDLDDRTFVLRDRLDNGHDVRCEYGPELEDAVKGFLDARVVVTGTLETNRTRTEKLIADSIEAVSDESTSGLDS